MTAALATEHKGPRFDHNYERILDTGPPVVVDKPCSPPQFSQDEYSIDSVTDFFTTPKTHDLQTQVVHIQELHKKNNRYLITSFVLAITSGVSTAHLLSTPVYELEAVDLVAHFTSSLALTMSGILGFRANSRLRRSLKSAKRTVGGSDQ